MILLQAIHIEHILFWQTIHLVFFSLHLFVYDWHFRIKLHILKVHKEQKVNGCSLCHCISASENIRVPVHRLIVNALAEATFPHYKQILKRVFLSVYLSIHFILPLLWTPFLIYFLKFTFRLVLCFVRVWLTFPCGNSKRNMHKKTHTQSDDSVEAVYLLYFSSLFFCA